MSSARCSPAALNDPLNPVTDGQRPMQPMHRVSTAPNTLNIALATTLGQRLPHRQLLLNRIIGPCVCVRESGDLPAFSRDRGAPGLYVLDASNGNLFFKHLKPHASLADAGQLARLERALFDRLIKLAGLRDESWTLEDGYEHPGTSVEALVDGLAPTVEIFNLTRVSAAVPLSRVQASARFASHPELPIIAMSQPLHPSECEPRQWDVDIASPQRAG